MSGNAAAPPLLLLDTAGALLLAIGLTLAGTPVAVLASGSVLPPPVDPVEAPEWIGIEVPALLGLGSAVLAGPTPDGPSAALPCGPAGLAEAVEATGLSLTTGSEVAASEHANALTSTAEGAISE
jgi:hypothetical protein